MNARDYDEMRYERCISEGEKAIDYVSEAFQLIRERIGSARFERTTNNEKQWETELAIRELLRLVKELTE